MPDTSIFVVDDDPLMRAVLQKTLSTHGTITALESGEQCLAAIVHSPPALVVMDVDMPKLDGYEACRQLKLVAPSVPVIFLSGNDQIEDRLRGYDAGGEDYLIKPIDPTELRAKVKQLLETHAAHRDAKSQADFASQTAMTAMTSLGEVGTLLQSLQRLHGFRSPEELAEGLLAGIDDYGLRGAVQVRTPWATVTRSSAGDASPIEASVISRMAEMERIVQFKTRLSVTYDHVSMLVGNMPADDIDRCGRLRDHLAMLVEGGETQVMGIIASEQSRRRGLAIEQAIASTTRTLERINNAQRDSRIAVNIAMQNLIDEIDRGYMGLGLSESQESFLSNIVRVGIDHLLRAQSTGAEVGDELAKLARDLGSLIEK